MRKSQGVVVSSSPLCPLFVISVWVLFHHEVIVRRIAQRTRTYRHTEFTSRKLSMTCLTNWVGECVVCCVLCVVCCVLCGVWCVLCVVWCVLCFSVIDTIFIWHPDSAPFLRPFLVPSSALCLDSEYGIMVHFWHPSTSQTILDTSHLASNKGRWTEY